MSSKRHVYDETYSSIWEASAIVDVMSKGICRGDMFFISGFETEGSNGTIRYVLKTPDTEVMVCFLFKLSGTSQTEYRLYEQTQITGGSEVIPTAINRRKGIASDVVAKKDPTVVDAGTLLDSSSVGKAGVTPSRGDVNALRHLSSMIAFKRNTYYMIELKSKDDDNIISYKLKWLEKDTKDLCPES